jgi:hypothetical protein
LGCGVGRDWIPRGSSGLDGYRIAELGSFPKRGENLKPQWARRTPAEIAEKGVGAT